MIAVAQGHLKVLQLLLAYTNGVKVDATTHEVSTMQLSSNIHFVRVVHVQHAKFETGHKATKELLVLVNICASITCLHKLQGQTALMLACYRGQIIVVRALIAYGACYNVQDDEVGLWAYLST